MFLSEEKIETLYNQPMYVALKSACMLLPT